MAGVIRRTLEAGRLNEIANHPDVRPHIGEAEGGALDFSTVIADARNITLLSDHGGFIFHDQGAGTYEAHSFFLRAGRGAQAITAGRAALRYVFTRTDCIDVLAMCPASNPAVAAFSKLLGFDLRFKRSAAWPTADGPVSAEFRGMSLERWALRSSETLAAGSDFHTNLDALKAEAGSTLPRHEDDPVHDAAVGAAILMVQAGQVAKGIAFYNRWAAFARYGPIALIAADPPIVDAGDAIFEITPFGLEALSCRAQR